VKPITDEELDALIRTYEAVCARIGEDAGSLALYWAQLHLSALTELKDLRDRGN